MRGDRGAMVRRCRSRMRPDQPIPPFDPTPVTVTKPLQARLSAASAGAVPPVPAAVPGGARRRPRGRPARVLWQDPGLASTPGLRRTSRTAQAEEMVRLCQAALRRAGSSACLSRPLHPSRRHLEQSPHRARRARRDLPLQGLSPQRAGPVLHDDAHNICCDPDGWVYVADRENHRVQVFDGNGKYETQWNNMHRPSGLYMESGTKTPRFFIGEIGPDMAVNIDLPNCGPRVSIYSSKGELLARLGHAHAGLEPGQFISPHGLAVDSRGDIYVGEVSFTNWGRRVRAKGEELPPGLRSLQKLVKVD